MKSFQLIPVLALSLGFLALTGCNSVKSALNPTPTHEYANYNRRGNQVMIRAKTDGTDFAGKSFRIEPETNRVAGDIDFNRYRKMIESGLISRGFVVADKDAQPDLVVWMNYGEHTPVTTVSERQEPTYSVTPARTVTKTEFDESTRATKRVTIEEPEVRTQTGSVTVNTSTTQYPYRVSLKAFAANKTSATPLWIVESALFKNEANQDRAMPPLVTAAAMYAGRHKDAQFEQYICDSTVVRLREAGKLPPPVVNTDPRISGLFQAFTSCRVDVRCDDTELKWQIENEAFNILRNYGITVDNNAPVAITLIHVDSPLDVLTMSIGKYDANKSFKSFYGVSQKDFGVTGKNTRGLVRWLFEEAKCNSDFESFEP